LNALFEPVSWAGWRRTVICFNLIRPEVKNIRSA
jgi:hypothetical protein